MPSPKTLTAGVFYRTGVTEAICRSGAGNFLVFCYHRIRPDGPGFSTPFDDGVFGPTASGFRAQMVWLKRHRRVLSERELVDLVYSERPPGAGAVITFDDGYRDNYTLALPILRELELPAIFFLPTALIEERRLGWWDLIAYFVKRSPRRSITLRGRDYALGSRSRQTIVQLFRIMELENAEATAGLVEELSRACEVAMPSLEEQDAELMSWAEVREASAAGVAPSSHSHTHRILKTLERDAVREELALSKDLLEARVGVRVETIAYPGGTYDHFDGEVQRLAAEAGYRLGFSFQTGVGAPTRSAAFDVKRLGPPDDLARFAAMVTMPRLFSYREVGRGRRGLA